MFCEKFIRIPAILWHTHAFEKYVERHSFCYNSAKRYLTDLKFRFDVKHTICKTFIKYNSYLNLKIVSEFFVKCISSIISDVDENQLHLEQSSEQRVLLKVGVHVGRCLPSLHIYAFAANPALTKLIPGCSPKGYSEQQSKYYNACQNLALGTRLHIHKYTRASRVHR